MALLGAVIALAVAAGGSDARALELMAQFRAAAGGAALDRPHAFRERGIMTRDGHQGTYETFGDLVGFRTASANTFDGKVRRGGFDGNASWSVAPDGTAKVATDEATLKGERLGTYLTLSGYLYPDRFPAAFHYQGRLKAGDGRDYEVVAVTPEGAETARLWLDPATHRLARLQAPDGPVTAEGEIGDWREVDGTWVGYALTIREAGQEVRLQLTDFGYIPADDSLFEAPAAAK